VLASKSTGRRGGGVDYAKGGLFVSDASVEHAGGGVWCGSGKICIERE
jgi:hypothetical protein